MQVGVPVRQAQGKQRGDYGRDPGEQNSEQEVAQGKHDHAKKRDSYRPVTVMTKLVLNN